MVKSKFFVGFIPIFLLCLVVSSVSAASRDDSQTAIKIAESRLSLVYKTVLEAEKAGANVSSLLYKLNNGSAMLSEAYMQYQIGNFSEAVNFANQSSNYLNGIESEANNLRDNTVMERNQRILTSTVVSALAVGAVLFAGVFGWRFFKDKYYKRSLKMKPEVQANDSE